MRCHWEGGSVADLTRWSDRIPANYPGSSGESPEICPYSATPASVSIYSGKRLSHSILVLFNLFW